MVRDAAPYIQWISITIYKNGQLYVRMVVGDLWGACQLGYEIFFLSAWQFHY